MGTAATPRTEEFDMWLPEDFQRLGALSELVARLAVEWVRRHRGVRRGPEPIGAHAGRDRLDLRDSVMIGPGAPRS